MYENQTILFIVGTEARIILDLSLTVCNPTLFYVGYGGVRRKEVVYSSTVVS